MIDDEVPVLHDSASPAAAPTTPRTQYAKGTAKRREILDTALHLIAKQGYQGSTLQQIADAVGLTKAGVLHYFESREALLAEILRERDDHVRARFDDSTGDSLDLLAAAVTENETTPGLVSLYSRLVVDAAVPEHPAHAYIADRYQRTVTAMADAARERQAAGELTTSIDAVTFGRIATAISDGLQLQWAYDDSIDMREAFDVVMTYFTEAARSSPDVG